MQSIAFGAGLNGGAMAIDGPTFMATEGWDWVPPMHDRDTGLWQNVHLVATGPVAIEDPQDITHLPLPAGYYAGRYHRECSAEKHFAAAGQRNSYCHSFEGVELQKEMNAPPWRTHDPALTGGVSAVASEPSSTVVAKRVRQAGTLSSGHSLRDKHPNIQRKEIAIRCPRSHLRIESAGPFRRAPSRGLRSHGRTHRNRATGGCHPRRHAPSSRRLGCIHYRWRRCIISTLRTVADTRATPYLILKVNGVRIAVRGGSWGMDDSRKRISRVHLEPFFRYDRDANLNIIRNWQGQNTEETFYELADKYGLMVWNDFWEVTQDSNAEAEDPQLFLNNARDTILRYRNHASIVMWCGRNEGVPQPIINQGLIQLTHSLDGTRSLLSQLEPGEPAEQRALLLRETPPTITRQLTRSFAVEIGTPSLPTLEWFSRWIPKVDRWPITDDWAYHNWHPHDAFNQHLQIQFGIARQPGRLRAQSPVDELRRLPRHLRRL